MTLVLAAAPAGLVAQNTAGDSLRLPALEDAAMRVDPRRRQLDLQAAQSALRLRSIVAERLPALTADAVAQYQSDVVAIPFRLPNGQAIPSPAHDTYDARLAIQQSLFDPSLAPRRAVERAQLAESQARVGAELFALRQEVDESFFAAATLQARLDELAAAIEDLGARRREAAVRVREGAGLPSDTAALDAAILERRQDEAAARADRGAALARLAALTGRAATEHDPLALPDLAAPAARVRASLADLRSRPEYETFARTRERLARQAAAASAGERPRLTAFGRLGYGRPGLNLLSDRFDAYWLGGVQLQWTPWTWGATGREREVLALQRQVVQADEAAFTASLRRSVTADIAAIDRLELAVAADERIIVLRQQVERETRTRFREGVVTAAEYVDRRTDLMRARVAQSTHRVDLERSRAHLLTTLGAEAR